MMSDKTGYGMIDFMTERANYKPVFHAVQDRDVPLKLSPHYRHDMPMFEQEQVVFGKREDGLYWEYSDRLWEWDRKKAEDSWKIASEAGHVKGSANAIQAYLSAYFGKPVDLVCVISGVNRGNGYPYNVYGFRDA